MNDERNFLITTWTLTVVAIVIAIGKLIIRHKVLHRLFWDDAFYAAAFVLLLASNILYTIQAQTSYRIIAVEEGKVPPLPPDVLNAMLHTTLQFNFALSLLFWTCLYAVKLSFLFLYRLILDRSGFRLLAWRMVLGVVFVCYWLCLAGLFAECGTASNLIKTENCYSTSSVALQQRLLIMQTVFNGISDILIMVLPIPVLLRLHIPLSQRIGVASLFFLAWVTIAFDILRVVESFRDGSSLALLYTSLETEVAVIVSGLPTYRVLLGRPTMQSLKNSILGKVKSPVSNGSTMLSPLKASFTTHGTDGRSTKSVKSDSVDDSTPPLPSMTADNSHSIV